MPLTVEHDVVHTLKGLPAPARIRYSESSDVAVYKRKVDLSGQRGQWVPTSGDSSGSPEPGRYGVVREFMNPGEIYEFALWPVGIDPNTSNEPRVELPLVCAVRDPSEAQIQLVDDIPPKVGGTYVHHHFNTGSRRTFARVYAADNQNIVKPIGLPWPTPTGFRVTNDFAQPHDVFVELSPGRGYTSWILLMDAQGNYSFLSKSYKAKERSIIIEWKKLVVVDDGDDEDTGEAEMKIVVFKTYNKAGSMLDKSHELITQWYTGNDDWPRDIDDTQGRNEISLASFGPLRFEPPQHTGDFYIGVNVHGREFDFFSDEAASNNPQYRSEFFRPVYLAYTTGIFEAQDSQPREMIIRAKPLPDILTDRNTFTFDVYLDYSVTYS